MGLWYGMMPWFAKIGIPAALHVYCDLFSGCSLNKRSNPVGVAGISILFIGTTAVWWILFMVRALRRADAVAAVGLTARVPQGLAGPVHRRRM